MGSMETGCNTCSQNDKREQIKFKEIKVMTLNYCGVAENPFQFYTNQFELQLTSISKIFTELCKRELKELFKEGRLFGKIEKSFKKGRYSPLLDYRVGILFNDQMHETNFSYRFASKQQFFDEWMIHFQIFRMKHSFLEGNEQLFKSKKIQLLNKRENFFSLSEISKQLISQISPKKKTPSRPQRNQQSIILQLRSSQKLQLNLTYKQSRNPLGNQFICLIKKKQPDQQSVRLTQQQLKSITEQIYQKKHNSIIIKNYTKDEIKSGKMNKQIEKLKQEKESFLELCEEEKINALKLFDYLVFKALLMYVFRIKVKDRELHSLLEKGFPQNDLQQLLINNFLCSYQQKEQIEKKLQEINVQKYIRIISPFFQLSFLDPKAKISIFNYGFQQYRPDLVFIQQSSDALKKFFSQTLKKQQQIPNQKNKPSQKSQKQNKKKRNKYEFVHDDGQIIIYKTNTFKEQQFKPLQIKDLLSNNKNIKNKEDQLHNKILAIQSDKYIIMSLHMASRQDVNKEQMIDLAKLLRFLRQHEQYKNKKIIIGGDLNSYQERIFSNIIKKEQDIPQYHFYPKNPKEITTFKKRSALQAQINKTDLVIKRSQDKIITTLDIVEGSITLIDGSPPDEYANDGQKDKKEEAEAESKKPTARKGEEENKNINQQFFETWKVIAQLGIQGADQVNRSKQQKEGLKSRIKRMLPSDHHPFDQFLVKATLRQTDNITL